MRRVHREPLTEATQAKLCELTCDVAAAGLAGGSTVGHRARARREAAKSHWANRTTNKAFREIREVLAQMAPGAGLCMYCEVSLGNTVDHFWPKEKYPGRAFDWRNYLWSCSICNTDHKGTKFPRDAHGGPLLINPAEEDPGLHLDFSPSTGKLTGVTPKGKATIEALGFDQRGNLDRARRGVWDGLEGLIVWYGVHRANDDAESALRVEQTIRRYPFASVLSILVACAADPSWRALLYPACVAVIESHSEIRSWPWDAATTRGTTR